MRKNKAKKPFYRENGRKTAKRVTKIKIKNFNK